MRTISRSQTERIYVKVNSDFDSTGYVQPKSIIWDDGRTFTIEKVKDFCPADLTGKTGDCYTVVIQGQEKHLFFERTDPLFTARVGRWFVEKTTG